MYRARGAGVRMEGGAHDEPQPLVPARHVQGEPAQAHASHSPHPPPVAPSTCPTQLPEPTVCCPAAASSRCMQCWAWCSVGSCVGKPHPRRQRAGACNRCMQHHVTSGQCKAMWSAGACAPGASTASPRCKHCKPQVQALQAPGASPASPRCKHASPRCKPCKPQVQALQAPGASPASPRCKPCKPQVQACEPQVQALQAPGASTASPRCKHASMQWDRRHSWCQTKCRAALRPSCSASTPI